MPKAKYDGKASASSPPSAEPPTADALTTIPTTSTDDAELIAICDRHIAIYHLYNSINSDLESESDPLWHAFVATLDFISEAKPRSLAGVIAKARAAKTVAMPCRVDGVENPEGTSAARWSYDLVNDLLRLARETT